MHGVSNLLPAAVVVPVVAIGMLLRLDACASYIVSSFDSIVYETIESMLMIMTCGKFFVSARIFRTKHVGSVLVNMLRYGDVPTVQ